MTRPVHKNPDLHGSVPETCPVALLLVDVVNDLSFEGSDALVRQAVPMAERLAGLKRRAKAVGIPSIYINDNFGRWKSDFRALVDHCLQDGVPGERMVRILEPEEDDFFVLKPKHSAFFETTLDTLLSYLGAHTLILGGVAGNICILFSANDAYMRDYDIVVPQDCVASNTPEANEYALEQIRTVLKGDTTLSTEVDLEALMDRSGEEGSQLRGRRDRIARNPPQSV